MELVKARWVTNYVQVAVKENVMEAKKQGGPFWRLDGSLLPFQTAAHLLRSLTTV